MLEVNSFFDGIYIYKFASKEGYTSKLEEFGASQDILDYADTLEEQYLGIVVGAVRQGKSLSEIQELVNKKKRVDELKSKTKSSIESEIPGHIKDSVKSWAINQIKKFPGKKNLILSNLDRIDNSVQEYRLNLASYDIDALLSYLNELEGKDSELSSDSEINNFLQKASEFAFKEFRKINNPKLISWAKVRLIAILKEWKSNIEKAAANTPFQEIMSAAYQLKEDIDAGKYRGKEIPYTPLRHHEYDSLISNIEFLDDWEKATSPDLFNMGFQEIIDASHEWHKAVAESGIGLQFNPINRSDIVWENDEYFILELKDENDLKVEGSKQNHCVGGYGEKIKRNECRIFSLRAKNAVYSPILTIETDMSGAIVRQDYGAGNSRIDKKYHDMVTEWSAGNVLDIKHLSKEDKYKLIERGGEDVLAQLANDEDVNIRFQVATTTKNQETLAQLANEEDYPIREMVAKRTTNEEILAQLAKDKNHYVRLAVANSRVANENILAQLANDKDADVRFSVVRKTTNENILAILANDKDPQIKLEVALKTEDENILAQLANDKEYNIRRAVARRTKNENTLAQLVNDKDFYVRQDVVERTKNEDLLFQLVNDESDYVRRAVISRTTNQDLLAQFKNDPNPSIKQIAQWKIDDLNKQKEKLKGLQEVLQQLNEDPNSSDNVKRAIIEEINKLTPSVKTANLSKAVNVFCKIVQASYN